MATRPSQGAHRSQEPKPRLVDFRGRVAVPEEVLQALDVKKGGYIAFLIDGDHVEVRKINWSLERDN